MEEMDFVKGPAPRTDADRPFIYDLNTRNISFVQTAFDLRKLGIRNNMFMLKLFNPALQGVDPFDPFLTKHQVMAILTECMVNPWYFLRECVRIPDQGGTGRPYALHRANAAATWCFLNGLDHYLVIPRQKGKTMSTIAILLWAFNFGTSTSEFMFINKRQDDANKNLQRLKEQRDLLPKYMRLKEAFVEDVGKIVKGQSNVKSMTNPATNNSIVTKPSATSMEAADGLGRGCTQPIQYFDEVEFTKYIKTIIEAAGPAYNTASQNARRNGAPYCRILTSTPGDLDTQPGQDGMLIIEGACRWTEKFYDWSMDKIKEFIRKNSDNNIIYMEYNYRQLGDGEEWFREACNSVLNNPIKIKREILLQRMRGSSESPFEREDLDTIQSFERPIMDELILNTHYRFDIYKELDRSRLYFVSVDCGGGNGGDNTAITVMDPYSMEPVAEFKSKYIGSRDTHVLLRTLVRKHIPQGLVIIERNALGDAVLEELRHSDIAHRLYFDNSKEAITVDDVLDKQGFIERRAANRKLYGVWTGKNSRELMMSILSEHVQHHKKLFVTKNIIGDLLTLVRKKNLKIEAASGYHDDSIMSYLVGLYILYYGKNLSRFGFDPSLRTGALEQMNGVDREANRQAEATQQLISEMSETDLELFGDQLDELVRGQSSYKQEANQYHAMIRQSELVDQRINTHTTVENFDIEDSYSRVDLSLFDELNS